MSTTAFDSIKTLREKLARKEISSSELLKITIERCKQLDPELGSILELFDYDSIIEASAKQGKLAGIPGLIKDTICQKNRKTTCASLILEGYQSPYDATAAHRLKEEGALLIGRANCDEFAMGSSTETSAYQKTVNPWDSFRVPGGSSGGSAAAVAAGLVPWALGSETGGSVRQPAALCGIVGSKPTYGLVSRYGLIAYASSLDQIGVFTRTVYDNALVLSCIAGNDPQDSTSLPQKNLDFTSNLTGKLPENLRIGIVTNALEAPGIVEDVQKALQESLKVFTSLGATVIPVKLPMLDYGAAVYFMLSRAEAASNLARFDGVRYGFRDRDADSLQEMYMATRGKGFGLEVKRRILIGNYVLSAGHADQYYKSAKHAQALMREEFEQAFKDVDVLFLPTSPSGAFKFGAFDDDRLQMDLQDYFTAPANLTGLPAISIPCGFTHDALPIGFQLFGPALSENSLYQIAHAYEQQTLWHTAHPPAFV
jgi:aspartyl-tRNA(Asn)/glutamyl-tRNA(Gln) amidotransferase subunit A